MPDIERVERFSLASDSAIAEADSLQLEAYAFYYALTRTAEDVSAGHTGIEPNLGGNLLYAGELDVRGRAMAIAGNVAGCAMLAATADVATQKQAIRDGAVDFVVTSLDEALRILKNEIRKRCTVAVCVGAAPANVEREMIERGVLPDLVFEGRPGDPGGVPPFGVDSRVIRLAEPDSKLAFLKWQVTQAPARWMVRLDTIALDCVQSDLWAHRWIRLSPRYCGRSAQAQRVLYCDPESAKQIVERFSAAVKYGAIETDVLASLTIGDETMESRLSCARPA